MPNHMKFKSPYTRQKRQRGYPGEQVWHVFIHCLSVLIKGTVIVTLSNMSRQCVSSLHSCDGHHHLPKFSPAPLYMTVSSSQCPGVCLDFFSLWSPAIILRHGLNVLLQIKHIINLYKISLLWKPSSFVGLLRVFFVKGSLVILCNFVVLNADPLTGQSEPVSAPSSCLFSIHATNSTPSHTSSTSWSKPSSVYPPQFPPVGWLHKNSPLSPAHFYRGWLCTDATLHYACGLVRSVWKFW